MMVARKAIQAITFTKVGSSMMPAQVSNMLEMGLVLKFVDTRGSTHQSTKPFMLRSARRLILA